MVILHFTGRIPLGTLSMVIRTAEREDSGELGRLDFEGYPHPTQTWSSVLC